MAYNGSVQVFEITEALAEVPGAEVSVRRGLVRVHIPALGDTAQLNPEVVTAAESVFVPTRAPAVQLDLKLCREILPALRDSLLGDMGEPWSFARSISCCSVRGRACG